jgi:hypothetical protein
MIQRAADRFDLDLSRSFVIGDRMADVGLAESAGARGVLVRTGYGESTIQENAGTAPGASLVATNLIEATAWILREHGHPLEHGYPRGRGDSRARGDSREHDAAHPQARDARLETR